MKKQTTATKIILGLIIFTFVVSVIQFAPPTQAATTSMAEIYANPNRNGSKNPYKFKVSDVINSQLLTNVVGCTGVVNKVATWMSRLLLSPAKKAEKAAESLEKFKDQLKATCGATKAGAQLLGGVTPFVNDMVTGVTTGISLLTMTAKTPGVGPGSVDTSAKGNLAAGKASAEKVKACQDQVEAADPKVLKEQMKQTQQEAEANLRTQCFDGIAITLAKNQLTAMTRSMMNWVKSGYGGNPLFVQNMINLTDNIERNVLETGIDILLAPGIENPYARDFARSAVASRGIVSSSARFLGSLQSDLGAFISDPQSYYTDAQLTDAERTEQALQRAREANDAFANDFATGGWSAYLALTQRDQNNPLGFAMLADQYISETQMQQVSVKTDELTRNNGFLNQEVCDKWHVYDITTGKPKFTVGGLSVPGLIMPVSPVLSDKDPKDGISPCVHWKTITPGSLIKNKTDAYLNSDIRQLELAKTINDFLNFLFSSLLSKLESGGLLGLSDSTVNTTNWTDSLNNLSDYSSSDGNTPYDNNGAYDGFNLTRDLGNIYIHGTYTELGSWNAGDNPMTGNITTNSEYADPQALNPNSGPILKKGSTLISNVSTYYTVNGPGQTVLVVGGYNNWQNGDRAFWDGTAWQNWKAGQENPIKNRGVIQTQEDYIFAAKEIMKVLPSVMTNLGELDYCLPGPNPSYKENSTGAQSAYQDWVNSMYVGLTDSTNKRFGVKIDNVGSRTYDDLYNIYTDNPGVWAKVKGNKTYTIDRNIMTSDGVGDGLQYLLTNFSNICNSNYSNCVGNYTYADPVTQNDSKHLEEKTYLMNVNSDYYNNNFFQNFYEVFDKMMNKIYFNNITQEFLRKETDTTTSAPNPDYIKMAQAGYDLTKDMLYYNDDISKAMQEYADGINQAGINIAKLGPIKNEVSAIITAAQVRRTSRMMDILNAEAERNGTPLLTEAEYYTKYADCLSEENMEFFDVNTILDTSADSGEKCSNKIDDDFDGLIDINDPDCPGYDPNNTGTTTPVVITPLVYNYYPVTSCQDNTAYYTGPFATGGIASGNIGNGSRLQSGIFGSYYVVTGDGDPVQQNLVYLPFIDTTPVIISDPSTPGANIVANGCPTSTVTPPTGNTCTPPAIYDQNTNTCITCIPPAYYYMGSCVNNANTQQTYTVTANIYNNSANGTVFPRTGTITNTVDANGQTTYGSVSFEIAPIAGHTIDFNGWSGNCIPTPVGVANRYTVGGNAQPITSDCNFTVTFQ
jgi:hypothetical protein